MAARNKQQPTARIITGHGFILVKRYPIKENEIAISKTETVFTSHTSLLVPVKAIKLLISVSAHATVRK